MPPTLTYLGHLLPNPILSQTWTEWLAYNAELSSTLQASWQLLVIVGNENLLCEPHWWMQHMFR